MEFRLFFWRCIMCLAGVYPEIRPAKHAKERENRRDLRAFFVFGFFWRSLVCLAGISILRSGPLNTQKNAKIEKEEGLRTFFVFGFFWRCLACLAGICPEI